MLHYSDDRCGETPGAFCAARLCQTTDTRLHSCGVYFLFNKGQQVGTNVFVTVCGGFSFLIRGPFHYKSHATFFKQYHLTMHIALQKKRGT